MHRPWPVPDGAKIAVPTGYCEFPHEILRPPRSLAARTYTNVRRWTVMPCGGHFAAMEQPKPSLQRYANFSGRFAADNISSQGLLREVLFPTYL
jgi:hypothetical protein